MKSLARYERGKMRRERAIGAPSGPAGCAAAERPGPLKKKKKSPAPSPQCLGTVQDARSDSAS